MTDEPKANEINPNESAIKRVPVEGYLIDLGWFDPTAYPSVNIDILRQCGKSFSTISVWMTEIIGGKSAITSRIQTNSVQLHNNGNSCIVDFSVRADGRFRLGAQIIGG